MSWKTEYLYGNNPESNPNYRTIFLYGTRFDQFGAENTKIDNPDKITIDNHARSVVGLSARKCEREKNNKIST